MAARLAGSTLLPEDDQLGDLRGVLLGEVLTDDELVPHRLQHEPRSSSVI